MAPWVTFSAYIVINFFLTSVMYYLMQKVTGLEDKSIIEK